jgi:hypothetical protein
MLKLSITNVWDIMRQCHLSLTGLHIWVTDTAVVSEQMMQQLFMWNINKGGATFSGRWDWLQCVCHVNLRKDLKMFCVGDLPRKFSFEFAYKNLLVRNVNGGNKSYTVPQLQRRQRNTFRLTGPESDHTELYSVCLPVAAWTCEWGEVYRYHHRKCFVKGITVRCNFMTIRIISLN